LKNMRTPHGRRAPAPLALATHAFQKRPEGKRPLE
jgi:hypothetical protein